MTSQTGHSKKCEPTWQGKYAGRKSFKVTPTRVGIREKTKGSRTAGRTFENTRKKGGGEKGSEKSGKYIRRRRALELFSGDPGAMHDWHATGWSPRWCFCRRSSNTPEESLYRGKCIGVVSIRKYRGDQRFRDERAGMSQAGDPSRNKGKRSKRRKVSRKEKVSDLNSASTTCAVVTPAKV